MNFLLTYLLPYLVHMFTAALYHHGDISASSSIMTNNSYNYDHGNLKSIKIHSVKLPIEINPNFLCKVKEAQILMFDGLS